MTCAKPLMTKWGVDITTGSLTVDGLRSEAKANRARLVGGRFRPAIRWLTVDSNAEWSVLQSDCDLLR